MDLIFSFLFLPSIKNIGNIKSSGLSIFSCVKRLIQGCFLLRLSLRFGYFPVIILSNCIMRQIYYTIIIQKLYYKTHEFKL